MIKHIKCDIFESGADVICHQVNCQGVMGSGIAKQVREKYPWVYKEYKKFCDTARKEGRSPLGCWQAIQIDEDNPRKYIINIFAQENFGYDAPDGTLATPTVPSARKTCSFNDTPYATF